ncbi:glycoside hydrolase family 97 protein [Chryseobacterium pennipullorum]|uniref:Glycoside hydrolase family 97 protein n=1 Tax=Chryseobacterium pennipullorum TaxID=2258963 RepID=A0A3D9B5I4_9FLAO|nr:glycoside hydrolase family 97 protein [Chryseobacterium pennipullorum]REC48884.1 glycoside hydrolase family 97 protein [Chryseobacterium pennipullorum]
MIKNILLVCISVVCGVGIHAQSFGSPNGKLQLNFTLKEEGSPYYSVQYKGKDILKESKLGFILKPSTSYFSGFKVENVTYTSENTTWKTVWGPNKEVVDHYKEMLVHLVQDKTGWKLDIRFRLFDDGLGFRYEFPVQPELRHFTINSELTSFNLAKDYKAFWIPADYDTNEFPVTTSALSQVPVLIDEVRKEPLAAKAPSKSVAVQTPLMLKSQDGVYINIHEAALVNFPAMTLNLDDKNFILASNLTPDKNDDRGFVQTGSVSPWRTMIISDDARDILSSNLIVNLNEPNTIKDPSWIKPTKYVGVWWEYFTGGGSTWAYSDNQDIRIGKTDFKTLKPNGRHGANTKHVKEYIDFASANGFDAVLVEGWNEGWEDNQAYRKEHIYSFTKAYPDFDVKELQAYAKSKNVKIIMHHESTSSVVDYERQLKEAFRFMKDNGYDAVKTGYVGPIIPRSEYHDGQWMVNHYRYVTETAAQYQIMVNSHEAVRPTGLHRTYPNWIAQESARGTEFESFNGNRPDHTTILPFTRLIGGPMDYTPGIFEGDLSVYGNNKAKLSTTLTKQLALYITMYSPLQMAADLIENYKKYPDAFQFIKDVAVDWDSSYVLEAEPGDYITIARKAKNKNEWFVGSITDENPREATVDLSFLPKGQKFEATIYKDGKNASWNHNPKSYEISKQKITAKEKLKIKVASGGGFAISIKALSR